jgi:hypothetical protein
MFISYDLQNIQLRNPLYPRSEGRSVIKVKSCNAFLRMLLVRVRSYLKLGMRHKYSILCTYYPDTLYLREQGCDDPWLFFEAKRGQRANMFGKHCPKRYQDWSSDIETES